MTLDLLEIGPHGETWWAIDTVSTETGLSLVKDGDHYCHPLAFCDLDGITAHLIDIARFDPPEFRSIAVLASSITLVEPYVWKRGTSRQAIDEEGEMEWP